MKIQFSKQFVKQYSKAPTKIKRAFDRRLELFIANPSHSLLRNHSLSGELKSYRSINITGDWRAIYRDIGSKEKISFFDMMGTHSQLYR